MFAIIVHFNIQKLKNKQTFIQTEKAKSSHFDRTRGDKNQIFPTIDFDNNGFMPLAPNVEIDVKLENGEINKRKISKPVKKPKEEKEKKVKKQKSSNTIFCDICGQGVPSPSALRIHIG